MAEFQVPPDDGGSIPTPPLQFIKAEYEAREIPLADMRAFVQQYHYAKGGSNTATHRFGLFRKESPDLLGIAWWLPPTKSAALSTYPANWKRVLSLSRLAVRPEVPKNACSFLIGYCTRFLKKEGKWEFLVTYADTWRGHTGAIYRAAGWTYMGLTKPERFYITSDGMMVSRKAGPKTRTHSEMLALGHTCVGSFAKHKYGLQLCQ